MLICRPEQKKLEILLGDVCKLETLPYFDVCISNTPYQVHFPPLASVSSLFCSIDDRFPRLWCSNYCNADHSQEHVS